MNVDNPIDTQKTIKDFSVPVGEPIEKPFQSQSPIKPSGWWFQPTPLKNDGLRESQLG